jgi:hypothetical protein
MVLLRLFLFIDASFFKQNNISLDMIYYKAKTYKSESFYEPFATKFFYLIMFIFQASCLSHKVIKAHPEFKTDYPTVRNIHFPSLLFVIVVSNECAVSY